MIEAIVYIFVLATALPIGWLLAWLCKDELAKDRKYFLWLAYFIIFISLVLMLFYFNIPILLSIAYMLIILAILAKFGRRYRTINKKKK